jgi:hypothetical protein
LIAVNETAVHPAADILDKGRGVPHLFGVNLPFARSYREVIPSRDSAV